MKFGIYPTIIKKGDVENCEICLSIEDYEFYHANPDERFWGLFVKDDEGFHLVHYSSNLIEVEDLARRIWGVDVNVPRGGSDTFDNPIPKLREALEACVDQIRQMQPMFNDEDRAIEETLNKAQEVLDYLNITPKAKKGIVFGM